jgi:hypothetical protein
VTPRDSLTISESVDVSSTERRRRLIRRFGAIGFWFFFLKGCAWLVSIITAFVLALE